MHPRIHIVVGADASNAFTEAQPATIPLYMKLHSQFHTLWKSMGQDHIADGYESRYIQHYIAILNRHASWRFFLIRSSPTLDLKYADTNHIYTTIHHTNARKYTVSIK